MVLHAGGTDDPATPVGGNTGAGSTPADVAARYAGARAQQQLFDPPAGAGGYDEFVDATGAVRPGWAELADCLAERGGPGLERLRATVRGLVDDDGITYVDVDGPRAAGSGAVDAAAATDAPSALPGPWQLDSLPLIVSAADWDVLESGVVQRSRVLDAVLTDLYGEGRAITSGVLPASLLFANSGYLRAARGIRIPGRHQLFLHGCDVGRAATEAGGHFVVNADWTQAPSGAGYALADRRVIAHAVPDLYERIGPRPAAPWAQALRLALIDAAPESADEPMVVVLTPGNLSETAFDQAYLATVLGVPLVESADLVVRDGTLWMRSLGTLERVDVVLRRVDAEYVDPLDLRPDSRLGVVGLVEAMRRGTVTVVNTLGSGILESPGVSRFLPELAQLLLGESLELPGAQHYWGGIDVERAHLLARLPSLLLRPAAGGRTLVGPMLSAARLDDLAARIGAEPSQWVGQELPVFATAPADDGPGGVGAAPVGVRLFTVAQRGGYAPMIGGLGYQLAPGPSAHRLSTVAAKDVWVRSPVRVTAERIGAATSRPVEAVPSPVPAGPSRPAWAISSPRVLSDMFWLGRYAERAENTARLLTVTRERYHDYRYRQDAEGSECVPVLLTALGEITGTDTGADGDAAEMIAIAPTTLWSLTADRTRPGSLAQSVERIGMTARALRDQMSGDTWMVLAAVERAVLQHSGAPPDSQSWGEAYLAAAHGQTLAGMLALAGVAAESMVQDVGWTVLDLGRRIERASWLTALLRATLVAVRERGAEQTVTEATLTACESAVVYRRRTLGKISIAAVADLVLFDGENPRALTYQFERIRAGLGALPSPSGSSRPRRLVDDVAARLRRLDPDDLGAITGGRRAVLAELLDATHADLRELSRAITAAHLSLPGDMQPLGGTGAGVR